MSRDAKWETKPAGPLFHARIFDFPGRGTIFLPRFSEGFRMTTASAPKKSVEMNALAKSVNVNNYKFEPRDRELSDKYLRTFVPPGTFDAHVHVYDLTHISPGTPPEEFGAICAFLCSQHAGYIVGQNILVDGGTYPGTL